MGFDKKLNLRKKLIKFFCPGHLDSILFEVTSRCNIRCQHCYNVWKCSDYPQKELNTAETIKLIDSIIEQTRCRHFTFTGGEPLLREDLEELVGHVSRKCGSITLITNGTLLTERRIKGLIAAGVGLFELPLNSSDRAMHDRMAGGFECFDKVARAAADIKINGSQIAFVFVATAINIADFEGALELGIALGARSFLFNRWNAGGAGASSPEKLMPSIEQIRRGLEVAQRFSSSYGIGIGASIAIPPCLIDMKEYPAVGTGFCAAGTDRAYYAIDPVGNVRPCNHTLTVIGNIKETPMKDLMKSQVMHEFSHAVTEFCRGCRLEKTCMGGCKSAAEVCYGSLLEAEPFLKLNMESARRWRASAQQ